MASASGSKAKAATERLYVGNLSPTVDEFTLVKLFSRYGKIVKLDFLFHMSGPSKGKPRGYAFVEMSTREEAVRTLVELHDKLVRGRKLVVTLANDDPNAGAVGRTGGPRKYSQAAQRPTALSIQRAKHQPKGTRNQIAALEAKLLALASAREASSPASDGEADEVDDFLASLEPSQPRASTSSATAPPAGAASLPARPSVATIEAAERNLEVALEMKREGARRVTEVEIEKMLAVETQRTQREMAQEASEESKDHAQGKEREVDDVPATAEPRLPPPAKVRPKAKKQVTSASLLKSAAWSKQKR